LSQFGHQLLKYHHFSLNLRVATTPALSAQKDESSIIANSGCFRAFCFLIGPV